MRAATTTTTTGTTVTTTATLLCNHMRKFLSTLQPNNSRINKVSSLLSQFYFPPKNRLIAAFTSLTNTPPSPSSSVDRTTQTQTKHSSIECSTFDKSIVLKCNTLFSNKDENKLVDASSLKDLLLDLSGVVPHITRKLRRFHELKPENVLELLLGYQIECGKDAIRVRKVETLWKIFNWGNKQNKGFKNLPRTYEVMSSMLIQNGMLKEFELLLVEMDSKGISLNDVEIFSNLIQSYVDIGECEKAVSVYDRMKGQGQGRGFAPSLSVYCSLINLLVEMKKTPLAYRVCLDMLAMEVDLRDIEIATIENVVRVLCRVEKIQEARKIVKEIMSLGFEPSRFVVNEIASGYCEKNDFDDLLSFFVAVNRVADVHVVNKIIHTLCSKFSVDRADVFRQKLECLGFMSDETTFGILIGWSCHDRNLKTGFMYLSEILSRGLKPDIRSYNAIIAAIFTEEGMRDHVRHVFDEMIENGPRPTLSTFTTMLAGYCKARRFEDAKTMVVEMAKMNLIQHSSLEDPLCKAFVILGLNRSTVRLKRDNDVKHSRTEFYDELGNGLFLDTDIDVYEKRVDEVLERSMLPDFNDFVTRQCECLDGDLRSALDVVDEMVRWGVEPSLRAFSALVKALCGSRSKIKSSISLVNQWPNLTSRLDRVTLDFLIRKYCEKGFTHQAWLLYREMVRKGIIVNSETYTMLVRGLRKKKKINEKGLCSTDKDVILDTINYDDRIGKFCKIGRLNTSVDLINNMLKNGNVPSSASYESVILGFCKCNQLNEATDFLTEMLDRNLTPSVDTRNLLVKQLCQTGETAEAERVLVWLVRLGEKPSKEMFYDLINRYRFESNVGKVSEIMQMMQRNGYDPDFESQWSLISDLSYRNEKDDKSNGFLSRLLSGSGFVWEKGSKVTTSVIRRFK